MNAAAARGRALPGRGFTRDVLHNSRAAAAAQEPQPVKLSSKAPQSSRGAKPSGQLHSAAAAVGPAQASAEAPQAQVRHPLCYASAFLPKLQLAARLKSVHISRKDQTAYTLCIVRYAFIFIHRLCMLRMMSGLLSKPVGMPRFSQ